MTTLILDLHEAASAIEADFSHLWKPQDPHRWYRPGALEPLIYPGAAPYYMRIRGEFVLIRDLSELPDTDIYHSSGLMIPRSIVTTLKNGGTEPIRGLQIVQTHALWLVWRWQKDTQYTYKNSRDWYMESMINPDVLRVENMPPCEYVNPHDIIWNAQCDHWALLTTYLHEVESRVREFVLENSYCEYVEEFAHYDMILRRGQDRRVEFYERYKHLQSEIADLERKRLELVEITGGD
jgi:hypothetical protein